MPREYPGKFALKLVSLYNDLVGDKLGVPNLPDDVPSVPDILDSMALSDVWEEAEMGQVVQYLRAGTSLSLSTVGFSQRQCRGERISWISEGSRLARFVLEASIGISAG